MPGYSGYQHQVVRSQVLADEPPGVPVTGANLVAGIAAFGSLLMLIGAWGTWVKITFFGQSAGFGGLHSELNGRYLLGLGIAALLTAGTALTSGQSSLQIRQICAGGLIAIGLVGLVIVIHVWTTISDGAEWFNDFAQSFASGVDQFGIDPSQRGAVLNAFAQGVHVSRGWGLWLSGIASSVTGLAGAFLFLVKQP
jgi:hypothetical protein